jgi:restriction system protein
MIPDFQTLMLPLLEFLSDKNEHDTQVLLKLISDKYELTPDEREELLPSGRQKIINNRIAWARIYLHKAGLIESPKRSIFKITEVGLKVLASKPQRIDIKFLKTIPAFKDWQASFAYQSKKGENDTSQSTDEVESVKTPEELLDYSFTKLKDELAIELLDKIKSCSPSFFEKLVVDLLLKMGYGGSLKDAGQATRATNDEGIDGIIKEDKLGLDVIYIQAKRWTTQTVGRPEIQSFVGALDGQRANKGIFITTSRFAPGAREYVKTITKKVILIDGKELADLMIEYNVGLSTKINYEVKKIDNDYFEEI